MALRTSEYLQRNELVRFQLNDAPGNNQHQQKMVINLQSTMDLHFLIGILDFLRFVFSFKN